MIKRGSSMAVLVLYLSCIVRLLDVESPSCKEAISVFSRLGTYKKKNHCMHTAGEGGGTLTSSSQPSPSALISFPAEKHLCKTTQLECAVKSHSPMLRHKGSLPHNCAILTNVGGSCEVSSSATAASKSTDSVTLSNSSSTSAP